MEAGTAIQERPLQMPAIAGETASTAAASRAKALVEARFVMALRMPRNWDQVRQDVMHECRRPGFADNKSVLYNKPVGDGIEGLGIRFVEAALRHMRNVDIDVSTTYDDAEKEIVHVHATDLESNANYGTDIKVVKTVERSKPLEDGSYVSVRTNSRGKKSYTVPATDDDLLNKRGALISKAIRTLGLRLIPGDIQDEAEAIIRKIRLDKAAADPDGERKRIVDAFGEIGVRAADLVEFLGHDLGQCSPAELVKLRGFYGAIRDGQTTWKEIMDSVADERTPGAVADLNERIRSGKAAATVAAGAATPTATKSGPSAPSYAEVAARINQAATLDAVDEAESLIDDAITDSTQRKELHDLARARRLELK